MTKTTTNTKGLLDWIIKLASLVITVPVTWAVARDVYGSGLFALPVLVAAVALVDALLLYSWYMLDYSPDLPPEQKWRHTLTVGILYAGLLVLSNVHREGVAGWVFRAALGIALANSVYNAHAQTIRDRLDKAKRGTRSDWRVQRHARKLSRQEAMYNRENEGKISRAQSKADTHVQLVDIDRKTTERLQPPAKERPQPVQREQSHTPSVNSGGQFDIHRMRSMWVDNPKISKSAMARELGCSRSTVHKYWDVVTTMNGNGHKVDVS
jgi:hypothetical protein